MLMDCNIFFQNERMTIFAPMQTKQEFTYQPHQGLPMSLVLILAVLAGISVANLYYCQPLLNLICQDTGLSEFQVNLMPVFTQVGYAMGLLFILPMGDLYNRHTTVLVSFLAVMLALLAVYFSRNTITLLAASFVTGFFSVSPQVFIPFVSLYAKPEFREQKVGIVLSGLLVGVLASRVLSGYVGHMLGWRAMFLIAAVIMGTSALVILRIFPRVEPTYKGSYLSLMLSLKQLVSRKSLFFSVRAGFAFGSMLGLWACIAFHMKAEPFCADSDTVALLALCGVAGAMTAANVGKYIPKYGHERINAIGISLVALSWVILWVLGNTYAGMIAGIILIDIGMQCIQLSNQNATMNLNPPAASRMNTIYMVIYFIGGSLGTFVCGSMWTIAGWNGTVLAGIALIGCSAIVSFFGKKVERNS